MAFNKETNKYEGYIYIITNTVNNKVYIGQTATTILNRWNGHKTQARANKHSDKLHNSMNYHGIDCFSIKEIKKIEATDYKKLVDKLDKSEIEYIEKYNSYYSGYNSTKGGRNDVSHYKKQVNKYDLDGNYIKTYESISDLKEEYDSVSTIYDVCSNPEKYKYTYGYMWRYVDYPYPLPKLSDSEKSQAILRYKMINPIVKYDYRGNYICTYKNSNEVICYEKITKRQLANCCTGKGNSVVDFSVYRFEGDAFDLYSINREKPKLVEQYDMNNNFINVFNSVREASRNTGIDNCCIAGCCRGIYKTSGGFIWRYV